MQVTIVAIVTTGVSSVGLSSCRGIMVPSLGGRTATVDDRSRKCRVIRQGAVRSKGDRKPRSVRMASTAERGGDRPHVNPILPRAHTVIAAPIAVVPNDTKRILRGEAFADLTCQDRALNRRNDGSVKLDQHRLGCQFIHDLAFITQDGSAFLLQLLLLEMTPE